MLSRRGWVAASLLRAKFWQFYEFQCVGVSLSTNPICTLRCGTKIKETELKFIPTVQQLQKCFRNDDICFCYVIYVGISLPQVNHISSLWVCIRLYYTLGICFTIFFSQKNTRKLHVLTSPGQYHFPRKFSIFRYLCLLLYKETKSTVTDHQETLNWKLERTDMLLTSGTADVAGRNMFDRRTIRNDNNKGFEWSEGMISLHSFYVQLK